MKTSNKLVLGLFLFLIVSVIAVNLFLKKEFDSNRSNTPATVLQTDSTNSNVPDNKSTKIDQ